MIREELRMFKNTVMAMSALLFAAAVTIGARNLTAVAEDCPETNWCDLTTNET
jgi:hypothetical protein